MKTPTLIRSDLSVELYEQFSAATQLGVDCEMMGLNPMRDRLCVVQVAVEHGPCVLVQIDESQNYSRLKEILEDVRICKIFHYARMDMLFLFSRLNINVNNIYCTKIASRLGRTYTNHHGLRELVREFIGENLDKTYQTSNWGAEQLKTEQIKYAAKDVIYLFEIRRQLEKIIETEKRQDLLKKLFNFLPVQRELDYLGYEGIFEHKQP